MSYALLYYFINVIESINAASCFVLICSSILFLFLFVGGTINEDADAIKRSFKFLPFAAMSLLMLIFLPSKNTALIMSGFIVAGDNIEQTVNEAVKMPPKLLELINKELDLMNSDEKKE